MGDSGAAAQVPRPARSAAPALVPVCPVSLNRFGTGGMQLAIDTGVPGT